MAEIIDGKALAAKFKWELAGQIQELSGRFNSRPGLATVLVGGNPGSIVYIRNKITACREAGIEAFDHHLPATTAEAELFSLIDSLGKNPKVHGILVQLPLPDHLSASKILDILPQAKDIDGFTKANWGKLFHAKTPAELTDCFIPCTPLGVLKMLESAGINPEGKLACVVGRSNIVGKPMAHLLMLHNATVTLCHSKTPNIADVIRQADIVIAAIGKPRFVKESMVKEGACVIDVGVNRLADGKLAGDCDFEGVKNKAACISPVPGGVGPMNIAMLLANTFKAWQKMEA
ncbi:MAG: bifunctional 5,10-methylenetetrahydrofolate dehydrogenase/5,10-methenyltetrahydrofolate cyclohydrolase [Elusimicrobia bacterium]|nr:bifunctional 5,10-methylenetetrahydrofolate dehydrogenase/5,10-methenyltetrahydrofolate cyclohydrolase [Elusimicrobiota bacterium]